MQSTFYAVSVGSGDSDLISVQAVKTLECSDVIFSPKTSKGATVALDIAKKACPKLETKKIISVDVPMVNDIDAVKKAQKDIAQQCESYLDIFKSVSFLTLGDVSFYSTAAQIADIIKADGYNVSYVAGVTSISAAAAKMASSLVEKDEMLTVIPADAAFKDGWISEALKNRGTKVLMKLGRSYMDIMKLLQNMKLMSSATLIQNCGMENERIFSLKGLKANSEKISESVSYFSIVIIKDRT